MEKSCFIIMPISDADAYPVGHFKRVYDFIIKPACELAGFKPFRADDVLNTNYIALDIVKNIIQADMALCDLSGRNPNVMYELGIRQAFNRPVTLIKDLSTERIFDISGFRDVSYDESLRIDSVQTNIEYIAETLQNTYETSGEEINSLVSLLGIEPAKVEKKTEISPDTELIMNAILGLELRINEIKNYSQTSNNAYYFPDGADNSSVYKTLTPEEVHQLKLGQKVQHQKFGKGIITKIEGLPNNPVVTIKWNEVSENKIMTNFAKLALIK